MVKILNILVLLYVRDILYQVYLSKVVRSDLRYALVDLLNTQYAVCFMQKQCL